MPQHLHGEGSRAVWCRTAGDVLRNLGAEGVEGLRGAYERLLKLGYGLSILGSVPLALLPIYDSMLWTVACVGPPPPVFPPLKDQPPPIIAPSPLQERLLTLLVVGTSLGSLLTSPFPLPPSCQMLVPLSVIRDQLHGAFIAGGVTLEGFYRVHVRLLITGPHEGAASKSRQLVWIDRRPGEVLQRSGTARRCTIRDRRPGKCAEV